MPSAELDGPDRSTAPSAASAPARRRRGVAVAVVAALVVVAAAITVARSQPEGLGPLEVQTDGQLAATAAKRAGTTCAGWPLELTPANRPTDVDGAVALWGERDAIHLANATAGSVVVDVVAQDGSLRVADGTAEALADDHLRATLAPGAEVSFTATCATAALGMATTPAAVGFATGLGRLASPVTLAKQRAG